MIWDIDEVDEVDSFVLTYGPEYIEAEPALAEVLIPEQHLVSIVLEAEDTTYTLHDLEEDTRYHVVLEGHLRGELVIQEQFLIYGINFTFLHLLNFSKDEEKFFYQNFCSGKYPSRLQIIVRSNDNLGRKGQQSIVD